MKKVVLLLMIFCAVNAVAQDSKNNSITVGYETGSENINGSDAYNINGVEGLFNHAFSLSKEDPFYLKVGAGVQYWYFSEASGQKDYLNLFSIKAPVNVSYVFNPNKKMTFEPFVGLNFRYNVSGIKGGDHISSYEVFSHDNNDYDGSNPYKRFQVGLNIGADFKYKNFKIGVSYTKDFSKLYYYHDEEYDTQYESARVSNISINFGFIINTSSTNKSSKKENVKKHKKSKPNVDEVYKRNM